MTSLDAVVLPDDLTWPDEFAPPLVSQSLRRALNGRAVIYTAPLQAGRLITLTGTREAGWITRAVMLSLDAMSQSSGAVYTLQLRGETHNVVFRHHDPPAFEAMPLFEYSDSPTPDFNAVVLYVPLLKLITV